MVVGKEKWERGIWGIGDEVEEGFVDVGGGLGRGGWDVVAMRPGGWLRDE